MSRTLTPAMLAAIRAERGYAIIHLIEMENSGGTLRIATSAQDISWSGQTWTAVGGHLQYGGSQETGDLKAQSVAMELSGVDGSIISAVLNNHFRGYEVVIYRAHIDVAAGTVVADPLEEFRGYQNKSYQITDDQQAENMGGGTVTVRTRLASRLADAALSNAVLTNLHSHRDMLRRAGFSFPDTEDRFFAMLPGIAGRQTPIWGGVPISRWSGAPRGGGREGNWDD